MDEHTIHSRISALVDQEHSIRTALTQGEISPEDEHLRLAALEQELDQCWDLLRQRDARRHAGAPTPTPPPRDRPARSRATSSNGRSVPPAAPTRPAGATDVRTR